jgi:hypothetical protein
MLNLLVDTEIVFRGNLSPAKGLLGRKVGTISQEVSAAFWILDVWVCFVFWFWQDLGLQRWLWRGGVFVPAMLLCQL